MSGDADNPSPIVHLSDGPRLVLADGSTVRLLVSDAGGDRSELPYHSEDQGASRFGTDEQLPVDIAIVDDPECTDVDAVERVLDAYGFDSEEAGA